MFKRLYMVFDLVAQTVIGSIIIETTDAPAIRAFHDALKMKESLLAQHPEDYNLLCLGMLSTDGTISLAQPETIATGASWKESQNVA